MSADGGPAPAGNTVRSTFELSQPTLAVCNSLRRVGSPHSPPALIFPPIESLMSINLKKSAVEHWGNRLMTQGRAMVRAGGSAPPADAS